MKRVLFYIVKGFLFLQEKKNLILYGTKYRYKK